ncbi:hypothetical protein SK128_005459 [Halocaridina rubra]|uniref:Uncharacterized protein n=1 Tax=Halocaridina rubra TaxID=373956 RepID=A0AAN8XH78_HALRR
MGGLTSKHIDELVDNFKHQGTPKMIKHLPFDPRSPSENITRTPITALDTTDSGADSTPAEAKTIRVIDPRSPIAEVTRTPIIVQKTDIKHRSQPLRPKTLMKLDSLSQSTEEENGNEQQDPRSPTIKVPRTPLEEKNIDLDPSISEEKERDEDIASKTESNVQENSVLVKKLFTIEKDGDKVRRPLATVQNNIKIEKTPRDLLQAKHCRNIEDEYNKTHQAILNQLPAQENTVKSNTEFVETI